MLSVRKSDDRIAMRARSAPLDTVTSVLATAVGNGDCEGAKSGAVPVRVPVFTVPVYRPFTVVVSTPFHSARAVRVAEPVAPVPVIPAGADRRVARRATAPRTLWVPSLQVTGPNDQSPWAASVR